MLILVDCEFKLMKVLLMVWGGGSEGKLVGPGFCITVFYWCMLLKPLAKNGYL